MKNKLSIFFYTTRISSFLIGIIDIFLNNIDSYRNIITILFLYYSDTGIFKDKLKFVIYVSNL